jgi:integrase
MRPTGSIRQRSKGYFQIRYNLGVDPLTGKRKRVEISHFGTYDSAKQELRRLLRTIDDQQHVEPNKIKVGEYLTQWLDTIRSQVGPTTHQRYTQIVVHYLVPRFGNCQLSKLAPVDIQQVYIDWEKGGRVDCKEGGLAPRTRLHMHRVLKLALRHAVRMRLIVFNPVDNVTAPRASKVTITTLTVEQSAILLAALRGKYIYWPVLLALATGMRRGEILALRWKNVDFEKKTVRVVESLEQTKKGIRFKAPKTNRTRAVLLPEYALEELRHRKDEQAKYLDDLKMKQTEDTLVCAGYDGEPIWPTSVTHEFTKAMIRLPNLPRVRFHDLRHSHATQLLTAGIHPKIAQERLGHTTISTTLDLYSHVTDTMQDDAAAKLDTAFRSAMKHISKLPYNLG